MDFSVSSLGGCHSAALTVAPFALLVGTGGQGKSSILRAAAAVLTGSKKAPAVLDGASTGRVSVMGADWSATLVLPAGDYQTQGRPPCVSDLAAGLTDYCALSAKDRAALLAPLIKSEPTRHDLAQALSACTFKADGVATTAEAEDCKSLALDPMRPYEVAIYRQTARLWADIQAQGWDSTHKAATSAATQAKGAWREVTGEVYGAKKAEDWTPEPWPAALAADPSALSLAAQAIETAKAARDAAIGKAALSARDLDHLRHLAAEPGVDPEAPVQQAQAALSEARAKLEALPPLADSAALALACPHCAEQITVTTKPVGGAEYQITLGKGNPGTYTPSALQSDRTTRRAAEAAVTKAERALDQAQRARATLAAHNAERAEARRQLEHLRQNGTQGTAALETAEAALSEAEASLAALKRHARAKDLHDTVNRETAIAKILAPEGLRKDILTKRLDETINATLAALTKAAGWPPITLGDDIAPTYDGRADGLSHSERWRTQLAVQVALAMLDGSPVVLVDNLDHCPPHARKGALLLLKASGLKAILALMADSPDKAPNLARARLGVTYWVENGTCHPIGNPTAQAAE
jgi:hypothetical protein